MTDETKAKYHGFIVPHMMIGHECENGKRVNITLKAPHGEHPGCIMIQENLTGRMLAYRNIDEALLEFLMQN